MTQSDIRRHLAGKDVSLRRLVLGHRLVLDVVAELVLARLAEALAGAADAVPTVQRNVDAGPVGRVGDDLPVATLDEAGDPVLEVQRYLKAHARPRSRKNG